jgi:hypothetical protein
MLAAASTAFSGGPASSTALFLLKFGAGTLEAVWLFIIVWAIASFLPSQSRKYAPGFCGGTKVSCFVPLSSIN